MKKAIVYDIGGTFVKWAIVNEKLEILKQDKFETFENDNDDKIKNLYKKIAKHINSFDKEEYEGIGISSSCVIDINTGYVYSNTDVFRNYAGFNIYDFINKATGMKVIAMNDGNSGALGEYLKGNLKNTSFGLMIVLGTGIGSGVIDNGKIFEGYRYWSGEVGKMYIDQNKTWEELASVRALTNNVSKAINQEVDGKYIFDNLDLPEIKEIYDQWLQYVAIGIKNSFHVLGLEKVVIGGGISNNETFMISDIMKKMKEMVDPEVYETINIEKAKLGNDANLLGVASLLF